MEVGSHIDAVAGARTVLDIGQADAGHDAVAQCDVGELLVLIFLFGVIGLDLGLSSGRCLLCVVRRRDRVGLSRLGGRSRGFRRSLGLQGSLRVQGDDDMIIAGGVRSGLGPLGQRRDTEQGDEQGLLYLAACLPIGVVGLVSARHQGRTSVASIGIVAKKPEQFGKAMLFPAMVETYAILALLVSILAINAL